MIQAELEAGLERIPLRVINRAWCCWIKICKHLNGVCFLAHMETEDEVAKWSIGVKRGTNTIECFQERITLEYDWWLEGIRM